MKKTYAKFVFSFLFCAAIITFLSANTASAQDMLSSQFYKKYTLTETFEVGLETSYLVPFDNKSPKKSSYTVNLGNIYLSLIHSINSNSSFSNQLIIY